MKGIHCALEGRLGRDAEVRSANTGRTFLKLAVAVGEDDQREWVDVSAWNDHIIDLAPSLTKGVDVYVEGRMSLRRWDSHDGPRVTLSVSASLVQPMALIGRSKPKAPRAAKKSAAKVDSQAPIAFADGIDARQGDELPF